MYFNLTIISIFKIKGINNLSQVVIALGIIINKVLIILSV